MRTQETFEYDGLSTQVELTKDIVQDDDGASRIYRTSQSLEARMSEHANKLGRERTYDSLFLSTAQCETFAPDHGCVALLQYLQITVKITCVYH